MTFAQITKKKKKLVHLRCCVHEKRKGKTFPVLERRSIKK